MEYRIIERENTLNPLKFEVPKKNGQLFTVRRGEFYTFQILLLSQTVLNARLYCKGFPEGIQNFTVFQQEGIDSQGHVWQKNISLEPGCWKLLWAGFLVSEKQKPGYFAGIIQVLSVDGGMLLEIPLELEVGDETAEEHGFGDIWNHSRLAWLNSKRGMDSGITRPYCPVRRQGMRLQILGRTVDLQSNGLFGQMRSSFRHDNSVLSSEEEICLFRKAPVFLLGNEPLGEGVLTFTEENDEAVAWLGRSSFSKGRVEISGRLEYDGYLSVRIQVYPEEQLVLEDVQLRFAYSEENSDFFIGLGYEGGRCPGQWDWRWDAARRQDCFFLGSVNCGMQVQLNDHFYHAPHVNIYYHNNPLRMPDGWANQGKGGITIRKDTNECEARIFCGEIILFQGMSQEYSFQCLFTPMKLINWKEKWEHRYFHRNSVPDSFEKVHLAEQAFANVVNLHHGSDLIPFINYPFFEEEAMARLAKEAHQRGIKIKPYYTVRELTNRIPEIFPFISLGEEIYPKDMGVTEGVPEQGGLDPWIEENLGKDRVIAAWKTTVRSGKHQGEECASVLVNSQSRIVNVYMEGLYWLLKKCDIDGVYIDDTGMDRTALRRLRKILDSAKEGCQIDLHSWNHFEDYYGAGYCSNVNLYLPLFPYLDCIWFGEGFCYQNTKPDYWLTAICGLMYGVPGELLGEESNNYKGLIYGMTNRVYEENECSPVPLWRFLLKWGIQNALLLGYWDSECPVVSDSLETVVSVYRQENRLLVVAANFSDEPERISLRFRFPGIQITECPEIAEYQPFSTFSPDAPVLLAPGEGRIFLGIVDSIQDI